MTIVASAIHGEAVRFQIATVAGAASASDCSARLANSAGVAADCRTTDEDHAQRPENPVERRADGVAPDACSGRGQPGGNSERTARQRDRPVANLIGEQPGVLADAVYPNRLARARTPGSAIAQAGPIDRSGPCE